MLEDLLDHSEHGTAALVFDRIVQQRRNGHLLVAAVVEHDGGHAQQMRDVRNAALLAVLIAMDLRRKQQSVVEAGGERDELAVEGA